MGLCASGDIFQAKVDKLFGDIEGVKTYINNKLVLGKGGSYHDIDHLRAISSKLCATGPKIKTPKYSFGLNYIP